MDNNILLKIPKKLVNNPTWLLGYYILVSLAPSIYFAINQPSNLNGKAIVILFPLAIYLLLLILSRHVGKSIVFLLPLAVLNALQIILFDLFGDDVVASDMFLNMVTTSSSEVSELLGSELIPILIICLLYIPPLILAIIQWRKGKQLNNKSRKRIFTLSMIFFISVLFLYAHANNNNGIKYTFEKDVYPVNAFYNFGYSIYKYDKIKHYYQTSQDFSFHASRHKTSSKRQIIVLVVGETGRAINWNLYGYHRKTNPLLENENDLVVFHDAITQSNVTHKSVPLILSSNDAYNFKDIYYRKGVIEAFKEAGFKTICFSNQSENGSFIEFLTKEADIYKDIRKEGSEKNPHDIVLYQLMKNAIETNSGDLFIVLHSYGSHFKYNERYPKSFSHFLPDKIKSVTRYERNQLVNAYDNSILYVDYFLAQIMDELKKTNAAAMVLYTSDHGEDIFDDDRNRFLHSSPTPTFYQLKIPFILWFSNEFEQEYPQKVSAAYQNQFKPINTSSVFHTLIDAGEITTPYWDKKLSLVNAGYTVYPRMFLTDHDVAVPYQKMNLKEEDFKMIQLYKMAP